MECDGAECQVSSCSSDQRQDRSADGSGRNDSSSSCYDASTAGLRKKQHVATFQAVEVRQR